MRSNLGWHMTSFAAMDVTPSSIYEVAGQRSKALEDSYLFLRLSGRFVSLIIYAIPTLHDIDAPNSF